MRTFEQIVADYEFRHRERASRELRFFAIQPTVERAVELAAAAKGPSGKRLAHQRRIPARVLDEAARRLLAHVKDLRCCCSFQELIEKVRDTIGPVRGIGPLAVYDTALRIGAHLNVEPEVVHLHAGTRDGARAIGLDVARDAISPSELPGPFTRLRPREIEDALCIYKAELLSITKHNS